MAYTFIVTSTRTMYFYTTTTNLIRIETSEYFGDSSCRAEAECPALDGAIYIYSVWFLQKVLQSVSVVQLVSVKDAPPLRSGGER